MYVHPCSSYTPSTSSKLICEKNSQKNLHKNVCTDIYRMSNNSETMDSTTASIKKKGNLNPMWGKRHDMRTKQKISDSQKTRYCNEKNSIKECDLLYRGNHDDMTRISLLRHLLDNNDIAFDSVNQVVDFLTIMIGKERLNEIIRCEIDKLIKQSY